MSTGTFDGEPKDFKSNFGMLIPAGVSEYDFLLKEDPNGVSIYAKCPSNGPCACTGKCREIIGYDTDPEKIKTYREDIERVNKNRKEYRESFGMRTWETDGKIQFITNRKQGEVIHPSVKSESGEELHFDSEGNLEDITIDEPPRFSAPKPWIRIIETYCKEQGIEPTELIEFYKKHHTSPV